MTTNTDESVSNTDESLSSTDESVHTVSPPRALRRDGVPLWLSIGLVIVMSGVGLAGAAIFNSSSAHLYASDSVIRVYNPYRLSGSQFGQVDPTTITSLELQYAKSRSMERAAADELKDRDGRYTRVVWTSQPDAATLTVKCFSKVAEDSTTCADTFGEVYTERRAELIAEPLRKQIDELSAQIDELTLQVRKLQEKINSQPGLEDRPTDKNRGRLAQQSALLGQISDLVAARQTVRIQATVVSQNYQVVSAPDVPDSLAEPVVLRNLAAGLVAGFLVGLLLSLLLSRMRPRRSLA